MVIDEYGNRRFYGLYRGVVADNNDPLSQGRLKLRVPQVLYDQTTDWAWVRNTPGVTVAPPAVGHGIWVQFEGGDPSFPIVVGTFGSPEIEFHAALPATYDPTTAEVGVDQDAFTHISNLDYIQMDTTNAVAPTTTGRIAWNDEDGTIDIKLKDGVTLQVGQEHLAMCANYTGSLIPEGAAVYVAGAQGQRLKVALASATNENNSATTLGIVTQSGGIPHGTSGYVTTGGLVRGLNLPTSTFSDGDALWLGTSPGTWSPVKPASPNHLVLVGYVVSASNGSSGVIYVHTQNGYELSELHDVLITSPTNGQALTYDNGQWKNATPASTLDSLTDVVISAPADNEVIAYDVATGQWTNQTTSEAGISVSGHTHVPTDVTNYVTASTGATYAGQWVKFASITLPAQYADSAAHINFINVGDGSNQVTGGQIRLRAKQQTALGTSPYVQIAVERGYTLGPEDFYATIVQNTPTVIIDFYIKIDETYRAYRFAPSVRESGNTYLTLYNGGSFVATVPSGVATVAAVADPGKVYGDISSVSGTLPVSQGGTGATTLTSGGYLKGTGTSAITSQTGIPGGDITSGRVGSLYGGMPTGSITQFATATAPSGWLNCDGGTFSSDTYPALATLLGDTYGVHSGTTYHLPDFRGRVAVGVGTGAGDGASGTTGSEPAGTALTARAIGAWGGAQTHALTSLQMPRHTHTDSGHTHSNSLTGTTTFAANGHSHAAIYSIGMNSGSLVGIAPDNGSADIWGATDYGGYIQTGHASWMNNQTVTYEVHRTTTGGNSSSATVGLSNANGTANIQYTGGSGTTQAASNGDAHPNIQPFLVVNYIIKT